MNVAGKKLLLCFLLVVFIDKLNAQNSYDSSLTTTTYKNLFGSNLPLFIGSEYVDYNHTITGNPFYESMHFSNGRVVYDGIEYNNVQLFYDLLNQDVVIKNYNDTALILVKEKVDAFNIAGHNFKQLFIDSASAHNKVAGFVDVLHDGSVQLLAKRQKVMGERYLGQDLEVFFKQIDDYFILKDSVFYRIENKKTALNILSDKKASLQKFIRQHKLKYRKDKEEYLVKLVEYYDGLNNTK